MKKSILLMSLLLSCALCANSFAKAEGEALDQIVAIINDDVITKSEVNHATSLAKLQIEQEHLPLPPPQVLNKQVIDQLINKRLQLQIAKQAGITITDADVDRAVGIVAKQNNMSTDSLYQRLNQEGMRTSDYRSEIRDQMTMQRLQQQEVISHIVVSPDEVTSFMQSQSWHNNSSKEYRIEDILIPLSDTPSSEEIAAARKHATAVVAKLNNGQSFQQVAQSESGDTHALQGGDLGWRKLPEIPSAFAEEVVHMKAKETSAPIQTANGFHIIRLAGARDTGSDASKPNRKQVEELLMQRKFEEAVQNWVSKLRSQAFIVLDPSKQSTANALS